MQDFDFSTLIQFFFQSFAMPHLPILLVIVLFLVYKQYKRSIKMEQKLFGRSKNSPIKMTGISLLFGVVAGLFASVIIVFLGINLVELGIVYLWVIVILLLLIHPRYMCFAYAAGIIGLASLVISSLSQYYPEILDIWILQDLAMINVPGLLALIAILHLTESILILVSGHISPSPVNIKHDNDGIVGGFSLQKFWPLPLMGIFATVAPETEMEFAMSMPDWWPLLGSTFSAPEGYQLIYSFFPVAAGLGYGDMAISSTPKEKSKNSAINLAGYSIILLILAISSAFITPLTWLAALISPIGHEAVVVLGNNREFSDPPLYSQRDRGIKVLDVLSNSVGEQMGLQPGDIILSVNNISVSSRQDLMANLYISQPYVRMNVETPYGDQKFVKAPLYENGLHLGVILAPEPDGSGGNYVTLKSKNSFESLVRKLLRK